MPGRRHSYAALYLGRGCLPCHWRARGEDGKLRAKPWSTSRGRGFAGGGRWMTTPRDAQGAARGGAHGGEGGGRPVRVAGGARLLLGVGPPGPPPSPYCYPVQPGPTPRTAERGLAPSGAPHGGHRRRVLVRPLSVPDPVGAVKSVRACVPLAKCCRAAARSPQKGSAGQGRTQVGDCPALLPCTAQPQGPVPNQVCRYVYARSSVRGPLRGTGGALRRDPAARQVPRLPSPDLWRISAAPPVENA